LRRSLRVRIGRKPGRIGADFDLRVAARRPIGWADVLPVSTTPAARRISVAVSAFRDAVATAAQNTPYTVVDTKKGFEVRLDIANARWWELYNRAGLRKTFRWRVKERRSHYTIFDRQVEMQWRAGVPGLSASVAAQGGRIFSLSRQKIWALSDRGRIEPVVDYKFNSREGRDLIRAVARQLGLKERLPFSLMFSLVMVLATPAVFAVWGLITLIGKLTGAHF
jgi:hypothetical protein